MIIIIVIIVIITGIHVIFMYYIYSFNVVSLFANFNLFQVVSQEHQHQNRAKAYCLPHSATSPVQFLPCLQGRQSYCGGQWKWDAGNSENILQ